MKIKILLGLLLAAHLGYGQNLFTKTISKIAKTIGKVNVETASTLDNVVPTVGIGSNLHSDKLGTISQTFFPGWVSGGDQCFIMFTKKDALGFVQVDGTVTIDGQPAGFVTAGSYSLITPANPSPRKFEVTTSSGQKSTFTIKPYTDAFKLKSINGETGENVSIDLSKDVVIEIENLKVPENALLKISLAINQLSIKSLYDLAYVRAGSTITIPAAAFRNINIKPGGDAVYNYKKSFLSIAYETVEKATDVSGAFPVIEYNRGYSDGKFVNVTTEPKLNTGLTIKDSDKDLNYQVYKPNAFLSRPFSQIKKVGLLSFSIRGTTFHESSETTTSTSTSVSNGEKTTTTTTSTKITTLEFPQQPNELWDRFLEQMYPEFMAVIQSEFGSTAVDPNTVTGTPSYKSTKAFANDDVNTKVQFARSFRDTKVISAFMPISEGYGVNGVNERIMKEAGVDALLTLTLDLQISEEKGGSGKVLMVPKLAYEIAGKANGLLTNTKYVTGNIESTTGVTFSKDITPEQLESIIRKTDLLSVFRKSLQQIKSQEKANGDYEVVWNLQQ